MPRAETLLSAWKGRPLKLFVRPWRVSDDSVAREVLERRAYERYGVKLAACALWLDVGAHIGTFALAAACEGCRVVAYEPHPENFKLLLRNLGRNRLQGQAECHEAALLTDAAALAAGGEVPLHLAPRSTSFHSTRTPFKNGRWLPVRAQGLEAVLAARPDIDGVKLDCEGEEMPLLESLTSRTHGHLLRPLRQLVFEWDFKRDRSTARLLRVLRRLERRGFSVELSQKKVFRVAEWHYWPSGVLVYARRARAR